MSDKSNGSVMALRSRLVSHLTGLSASQLQRWHATSLQEAHREAGQRGVPRLYSWVDYRRLCVISSLLEQDVPTKRIRVAIAFLDELFPGWHNLGVTRTDARIPNTRSTIHVLVQAPGVDAIADGAGQLTMSQLERELELAQEPLRQSVSNLVDCGPLFRLSRYSDAVTMDPHLNVGLPTVKGTRLETAFIAGMVADYCGSVERVAKIYRIAPAVIGRALEFQEAAA